MELDLRMILKAFKYVGLSMKEFAIREGLSASTLYSISSQKQTYTEEYSNYICYLLERDWVCVTISDSMVRYNQKRRSLPTCRRIE